MTAARARARRPSSAPTFAFDAKNRRRSVRLPARREARCRQARAEMLNLDTIRRLWVCLALSALGLAACDDADKCKTVPECAAQGKCAADKNGLCIVSSDQDCKGSALCKEHGKCSAKDGECRVVADGDCKPSDDCQKLHMCSAHEGACVDPGRTVYAECAKTCGSEGLCASEGGKCVALSRQHCAGTSEDKPEKESPCAKLGHCTAKGGKCVAGSDQDCAKSASCKESAQCVAKDDRCVASEDDCKKSSACSNDGKCGAKDGECLALSNADCKKSARCKLEGTCTLKGGRCIAGSSGDCAQASVCAQAKRCAAKDGACVAAGGGGVAQSSDAPDKTRKTTIDSVF